MARIAALAAFALTLACAGGVERTEVAANEIRPRGDGNIAVEAELDRARRQGTVEAYDLFLARQGDHPLAEIARRERADLIRRQRRR